MSRRIRSFRITSYLLTSCLVLLATVLLAMSGEPAGASEKLRALIVDGQNNHRVWPETTQMMKGYLEQTGLFDVEIATTRPQGVDPDFAPSFADYDVVVSNYNGEPWPEGTQEAFVKYVRDGGGFVVVHAANNAFGNWNDYNRMIGLGGWGGRTEKSGPYLYFTDKGQLERDSAAGRGGSHGARHPFLVQVRDSQHPVTKGMPAAWMHARDELYDRLRGPAEDVTVLATAYSSPDFGGTGRHEPMIFTVKFGEGRVFHTPMGHDQEAMNCAGFITTLQRGAEWAATGKVTQPLPQDFPTADAVQSR